MNWRDIFGAAKGIEPSGPEQGKRDAAHVKLDFDALDDCVGGKPEGDGVGCYVRSTQPRDH